MNTKFAALSRLIVLTIFAIALGIAHPANADFIDQEAASPSPGAPEAGSNLSIDSVTQAEGTGGTTNFIFTVTLTPADPVDTVTVDFATADNTATQPGDYASTSGTLTFVPNDTSETITVSVVADTLDEANETFNVNLSNATNANITQGQGVGTITDDDAPPTVAFTAASQSQDEGVGTMTVTAQLNAVSGLVVTVPFSVTGTATGGTDYTITATPVTIPAGNTSTNITINVTNDILDENNETVIVTMGAPTNATQGATIVHTATINDNDAQPTVSFTSASQSQDEGVGTMTVTAQLNTPSGLVVTVPFSTGGTATAGTDYTITATPVTIPAGNTTTNITISVTNDILDENNETVIVTMGAPTNATQGATTVHTATINDNDAQPTVSFTAASQSQDEGVGTMTVTAQLNTPSGLVVTVPFSTGGTATAGTDYTITATPVTIPAGNTTTNIVITVNNDALPESNETVIVTMGAPTNATPGGITVHTATILDNDNQPTVAFTSASQSQGEGIGSMIITAQLDGTSGLDVTVPFTITGTATGGTDYTITASPVTIPAGSLSTTITITVTDDALPEGNETVIVTMGTPTNANQGSPSVHTATILDNDAQPTVAFTAASQNQDEGIGTMIITAQLSFISGLDVSVPFTMGGTATNGTDYTITASPVTILAGTLSTTITITVNNDTLDESNETVIVTMGTPTNATPGLITVHTATILDNDATPTVSFTAASQSALENIPTMTVTAQLSAISGLAVSVPFTVTGTATEGTDYTITASPVTIPAGSQSTNIVITVTNDTLSESNETVIVTMGTPINATPAGITVHTATILDNDALPTVSFTSASQSSAEDIPTMTVTAQLNTISGLAVTVPFTVTGTATSGTDYTITASPVTIPAGSLSTAIVITVINDSVDENDETVVVTMGAPTNATPGSTTVHTATILDNDVSDATVDPITLLTAEKGLPVPFTIKLNAQPTHLVTIGISSADTTEGTVSPVSLAFTAVNWNTPQTVTVTPVDDFKPDGAITYKILTAAAVSTDPNYSGYNAPDISVTNADNDTPGIAIAPLIDLTTSEGRLADDIQIVLNTEPDFDVDITLLSLDQSEGKFQNPEDLNGPLIGELTITFTPLNWQTVQQVFLVGVDDLIMDGDKPYSIKVTSASADPIYNNVPLPDLAAINETSPSIEWVLPVKDNGIYETDTLVPIRLRVRPISPEPISLVRFVRFDPVEQIWVTIAEDDKAPYETFVKPTDLRLGLDNQINAYAFDPAGDSWSIQKKIWIFRRGSVYKFFLPIVLNQP